MKTSRAPLLLSSLLFVFLACKKEDAASDAAKVTAEVETEAVQAHELSRYVQGYGSVIPTSSGTLNISLPRAIVVSKILVVPGQAVSKGQALFESTTEATGRLAYKQAQVASQAAEAEFMRIKDLLSKQLATTSQLAIAEKAYSDAREILKSESAMGNGSEKFIFKSPFQGSVATLSATPGDHLQAGAPLMQLSGSSAAQVALGVEPDEAAQIKAGMEVQIRTSATAASVGAGLVRTISQSINPVTQLVDIWVDLTSNPYMVGSKVYGDVKVETIEALAVPRSAVLLSDEKNSIFLVNGGKATMVDVKKGLETADYVAIEGAVKAGDKVIRLGNYVLEDGMAVTEKSP